MKVLLVFSANVKNFDFEIHKAFVYEQMVSLRENYYVEFDYYGIKGKGIKGYLKNIKILKNKINEFKPDIIHAHYGLSGLLTSFVANKPLVVTFHGSDCKSVFNILLSNIAHLISKKSIFVNINLFNKLLIKRKAKIEIVKCGVDTDKFKIIPKDEARRILKLENNKKYILFSSSFERTEKNYSLAHNALKIVEDDNIELIELKNKSREEVKLYLNSVDLLLLTSISEGSPQIIKEAMLCNCPIVATDVGDIKEIMGETKGCYITSFAPKEVAEKIKEAIKFSEIYNRTNGREKVQIFDNKIISERIFNVYNYILKK